MNDITDEYYEWDESKEQSNIAKHGLNFEAMKAFIWETSITYEDRRFHYRERRFATIGAIHGRLHHVVYTYRCSRIRIISLRKANGRERKRYERAQKS